MRTFFALFAILVSTSWSGAAACPTQQARTAPPALAPLMVGGPGTQLYYCMPPQTGPGTIGDLTPEEFGKYVQICNTNCSYEPMSPTDPHTLLIPTTCGPGGHDTQFLVEPPAAPRNTLRLHLVDDSCKGLMPSKAPPPPEPSPTASPHA